MAAQFVDPHGDLRAEGRRHRVLAVRSAGDRVVLRALGEVGECLDQPRELREHDPVRLADLQQVARLGDVLRRGAPVDVAAGIALAEPVELPDQRDQAVPGHAQPLGHALEVEQLEPRLALDLLGGCGGNHADLGLGAGQRDLDIEPRLPARVAREKLPDPGIADAQRARSFSGHRVLLAARGCYAIGAAPGRLQRPPTSVSEGATLLFGRGELAYPAHIPRNRGRHPDELLVCGPKFAIESLRQRQIVCVVGCPLAEPGSPVPWPGRADWAPRAVRGVMPAGSRSVPWPLPRSVLPAPRADAGHSPPPRA